MGSLTLFMHISLDGFAAAADGKLNWIHVDDEIFDHGSKRIYQTDTALYGKNTYLLMEGYWPTAADKPDPSKHDLEHSQWYKQAKKAVLSTTLEDPKRAGTKVIRKDLAAELEKVKKNTEKEILIFGSPSAAHSLMAADLIDNYWFNVNPVLLGQGVPVFKNLAAKTNLSLVSSHVYTSGVVSLSYTRKK